MKRIGKNETTEMAPVKKCFVGLETALYLLFLALDAFSAGGDGVKYLTIVVCLLAAVWSARHGGSRLMAWAMAFTLAADTFLLLLDRWYGAGIALFCVVQGLEDGMPAKPDPTGVRRVLAKLQVPARQVLYVGDSDTDMRTAAAAGLDSCGVLWGFRSREVLLEGGARHLCRTAEELLTLILSGPTAL